MAVGTTLTAYSINGKIPETNERLNKSTRMLFWARSFVDVNVCHVLRDLVQFIQFKKREKHQWKSITFSKVAGYPETLLKVTLLHGVFHLF